MDEARPLAAPAAAEAERRRLTGMSANKANPAGWAALEEWLLPTVKTGEPVPAGTVGNSTWVARTYVAALTGGLAGHVVRFAKAHGLRKHRDLNQHSECIFDTVRMCV
ncbi:hypothetical protein OG883_39735 [Streptomyces sp. NBC_01142]|uniref:hypothetical protein n=1 Tax=Streptomyces sp. NBC_01142 TaxID=2975865 RepID=UPI00224FF4B5|nr:hypothetical protein [Streptomyces sp. NBC_01142]MCX4825845.1 hypothetical protein [Streptomyces sp. NBC_01142]